MKVKIIVADNSFLIRQGLRSIIEQHKNFTLMGEAEKAEDLNEKLRLHPPDVLIIDYASRFFCLDDILIIHQHFPDVNILAITYPQNKPVIAKAIENGAMSHLLKDCGREEIIEAIHFTAKSKKFLCGKIVDILMKDNLSLPSTGISCDGIKLSNREIEIIRLVAEGLSNKQVADKLFLSTHTVATHRKNIMSKIGVNNTASLVMFAVKQNLIIPPVLAS